MFKKVLFLTAGLLLLIVSSMLADWSPGDGHKMHYPQLPDETGWAVNATQPMILADDWRCSETGWIKDFHFWGAWKHQDEGQINYFVLSIHDDIPADQSPTGWSMPGNTLLEIDIIDWVAVPIDPPTLEGWYDPSTGEIIPEDHQAYWQYNVVLPEAAWFWQEEDTIYWFNISAIVQDPANTTWGWKSSINHFNDDAVWAQWGNLNWIEMYEPGPPPLHNDFFITIDPLGNFIGGGGTDFYGDGWYFYPNSDWWNIWFYDHPFDYDRKKVAHIEFDLFLLQPGAPSSIEFAVNWSTDQWSLDQPVGDSFPPLPGVDEALYIGRDILYAGEVINGHYVFDWVWPDYNPEWVSIDVRGINFEIPFGFIEHNCIQSLDLSFVVTGDGGTSQDTCEYYKPGYGDFAPNGMPDIDQKQGNWWDPSTGNFSWCGPTALANCVWWFDSKFEPNPSPVDPRPFYPGPGNPPLDDNYGLVTSYDPAGLWDDHDTNNVVPFINDLAGHCQTDMIGPGTSLPDLDAGFHSYLAAQGMTGQYSSYVSLGPSFTEVKDSILSCQDVILLLGFYEEDPTGAGCEWLGGHYVTAAGVCTTSTNVCISDPFFDANEGEPPPGTAHGPTVHNDASLVSGPHGTIHHDAYNMSPVAHNCNSPATEEFTNYPNQWLTDGIFTFQGQNPLNPGMPGGAYQGNNILVLVEAALIICPQDTCDLQNPGDVNNDGAIGIIDITYLLSYLYQGGPPPPVMANADPNGDCCIDVKDVAFLIDLIFSAGPPPVSCTCVNPPVCTTPSPDHTPGKVRSFIDGYIPAFGSPVGHQLEELWPNFTEQMMIQIWHDNGDGFLTPDDILRFWSHTYNAPSRARVEEVTSTLVLAVVGTNDTLYIEMIGPPVPYPDPIGTISSPIGTLWHESHPNYCNTYEIVFWDNFVGPYLSLGDQVMINALNGSSIGTTKTCQVADIRTDIIVSPLAMEPADEYDHNLDGWRPWMAASPVGTFWSELWPNYGDHWILDKWIDNGSGMFDYCDTIEFVNTIDPAQRVRKHIEQVAPTIKVSDPSGIDTLYLDFMCGNPHVDNMSNVLNTYWMEVHPNLHKRYICLNWTDNGNGFLDFCDWIDIMSITGADSGMVYPVHVEAFQTDIVTTILSCCVLRGDINHDGSIDITDLTFFVDYMFGGGPPPPCLEEADLNNDGTIDITDLTYLVDYMFGGGPAPVRCP